MLLTVSVLGLTCTACHDMSKMGPLFGMSGGLMANPDSTRRLELEQTLDGEIDAPTAMHDQAMVGPQSYAFAFDGQRQSHFAPLNPENGKDSNVLTRLALRFVSNGWIDRPDIVLRLVGLNERQVVDGANGAAPASEPPDVAQELEKVVGWPASQINLEFPVDDPIWRRWSGAGAVAVAVYVKPRPNVNANSTRPLLRLSLNRFRYRSSKVDVLISNEGSIIHSR